MSIDPETLEYLAVEARVMEMAAAAYRDGLTTRLTARSIVTDEVLPTLSFLGHSLGLHHWTKIETSQGTHWHIEGHETKTDELRNLAFNLGDSDGYDRWRRADGNGWYE